MRVALVHDWLVNQRGGENVLDAICELYPNADLFTLLYQPGVVSSNIVRLNRRESWLQRVPFARTKYRHLLPILPWVIEGFDFSEYDLVISSSHCVAKGALKAPGAKHLSYVHAPMRYMWDRFDEYFGPGRYGWMTRLGAHLMRPALQNWDRKSAAGVDQFVANSRFIAGKISQFYSRTSKVIYPFCDASAFMRPRSAGKNFLMVTALVPYKRVDLAIEAFNELGYPLVIVGDGPDLQRLKSLSKPNIDFVGSLKRESLADLYSRCRALVFPGIEDFGIVPLEAMAAGAPVIAFGEGGVLETVTPETGVFFKDHSKQGLIEAILDFERRSFAENACRARAQEFSRARFQAEFLDAVSETLKSGTFAQTARSAP
jgi:glycosyltransferase involved in cell wall biosynthesis